MESELTCCLSDDIHVFSTLNQAASLTQNSATAVSQTSSAAQTTAPQTSEPNGAGNSVLRVTDSGNDGGISGEGDSQSNVSKRDPSSTMSIILVVQMQFLALLSLVNMSAIQDSFLGEFVESLR